MRKLFVKLEQWIFNDESTILSLMKFFLVVGVAVFTVVFIIATIVAVVNPHEHTVLDLTTDWSCTASHTELQRVHHGKTSRMEDVVVCDNYKRK